MDVLEAIKTRRSIRKYEKRPVPEELLEKILEAGRWAPSADNAQPWNFILLRDEGVRREVARVSTYGKFLAEAPLGIAVVVDPQASTQPVADGAIATQNMLLAAHALGLGACYIGSYGTVYEEKAKKILGIPENKRLLSLISVGFPTESRKSAREELREIVFVDRYGKT